MTPRCVLVALPALVLAACGGGNGGAPPATATSGATARAGGGAATPAGGAATAAAAGAATPTGGAAAGVGAPRLTGAHDCAAGTCSTLRVPLDHSGRTPGTLDLQVATRGRASAPVLVTLTGGPGQPGVSFLTGFNSRLGAKTDAKLRLVAIDQRGTGGGALRCPALQRQMGGSDLTPPTPEAVSSCGAAIGPRRAFFTTNDTVADLEALRIALGVDKLALDGISYGTYVAERYALAHPDHVSRLVLDSVVPQENLSMLSTVPMQATARVMGPQATADIATVVRRRHDGPQLLDLITALSIGRPHLTVAARAIHAAAGGDDKPLDRLAASVHRVEDTYTAPLLSQGLHASTLCGDTPAPWGGPATPLAGRRAALDSAVAQLHPSALGPFDRATAAGNGIALSCLYWPPTPVTPPPAGGDLPAVPTLILAGDKDLSTPLEWARAEHARIPGATLMIVPGAGHSLQTQQRPEVDAAVSRFLGS